MVQSMNLRMKLFLLITLIVTITFSVVGLVVSYRSMEMSREDALSLADQMAAKYSYEIKSELQAARVSSESLMTVFKTLIDRGEADRDTLNAILQNSLKQKNTLFHSAWLSNRTNWTAKTLNTPGNTRFTTSPAAMRRIGACRMGK